MRLVLVFPPQPLLAKEGFSSLGSQTLFFWFNFSFPFFLVSKVVFLRGCQQDFLGDFLMFFAQIFTSSLRAPYDLTHPIKDAL